MISILVMCEMLINNKDGRQITLYNFRFYEFHLPMCIGKYTVDVH